jgi:hypothetical protein
MGFLTDRWRSQVATRTLHKADSLVKQNRYPEAIRLLTKANSRLHNSEIEILLVNLRHESFFHHVPTSSLASWPPRPDDLYADQPGIPEIEHQDFTAANVASGVFNHGSIIVRNMLTADQVSLMRDSIIQTYAQHDKAMAGAPETETAPWFVPFNPAPREGTEAIVDRAWFRRTGAELASDSPRGLFNLINCLQDAGITDMVTEYLGERPALSVRKTSLRQVPKDVNAEHGWHQEGAFLGHGILRSRWGTTGFFRSGPTFRPTTAWMRRIPRFGTLEKPLPSSMTSATWSLFRSQQDARSPMGSMILFGILSST